MHAATHTRHTYNPWARRTCRSQARDFRDSFCGWYVLHAFERTHGRLEREAFLSWRRAFATFEDNKLLTITPFEKNIEMWRQLWRVRVRLVCTRVHVSGCVWM